MELDKCKCGNKAVWFHMPGSGRYCDDCVPRGCSCNEEPTDGDWENPNVENWKEITDEQGRLFPCCEYFYMAD